jgi:hypothetical protein
MEMQTHGMVRINRIAGILAGLSVLSLSLLAAGIVCTYLTEYGARRVLVAAGVVALGLVVGVAAYLLVSTRCRRKCCGVMVFVLLLVLLLMPLVSMAYPGKVLYSSFGWTVYGLVPVPVLDITVGPHGALWFRDKSHLVSIDEVQPLLSPAVEVLVIGIGWHSAAGVDPAIEELEGIEIHILPTPDAFDLFNRYVSAGRRVALIAHSTC